METSGKPLQEPYFLNDKCFPNTRNISFYVGTQLLIYSSLRVSSTPHVEDRNKSGRNVETFRSKSFKTILFCARKIT